MPEVSTQVGWLVPSKLGYWVCCLSCQPKSTNTPIYDVNLGQYQQHCLSCGKQVNPSAREGWPELYDGK